MAETTFTKPPATPLKGGGGKGISKVMFGLPMWAWLAIIGVAIVLAVYMRSQGSEEPAEEEYVDPEAEYETDYSEPAAGSGGDSGAAADEWAEFPEVDDEEPTEEEDDPGFVFNINTGQDDQPAGHAKKKKKKPGQKGKPGKGKPGKPGNKPGKGKPGKGGGNGKQGQKAQPGKANPKGKPKPSTRAGVNRKVVGGGGAPARKPVAAVHKPPVKKVAAPAHKPQPKKRR